MLAAGCRYVGREMLATGLTNDCRGSDSENDNRQPLKCRFPREIGRSQVPRRQQEIATFCSAQRSGFQPRESSRFGGPSRPQFPGLQQAQVNALTSEQAADMPERIITGIQLAVGPQPLWLRNHNSGPAQRIMVKCLATSPHDPLGITDSACKNQSVVVSVLYGPFNPYIPIRSATIGKSRVARDPIAMHTSWRSNSDIASVTR
ncbi:dnaJsubfamily C member 17-like [Dorcoceras hygrometricum]|uniref:DnaJsubfamily C member 17-like n=1 Tax=Dorcoceras hygrometricum TaxID=472368 RepID=A0A2Z7CZE0_9LAMI|nr:dnaJsubfamily C member 17-like [Dorcoceras hygrometricum]